MFVHDASAGVRRAVAPGVVCGRGITTRGFVSADGRRGWPCRRRDGTGRADGVESHRARDLPLEPGDTFVLFSDGVSEAMNAAEDFYGEERLLRRCRRAQARRPQTSSRRVWRRRAFVAGAKQSDDITVLAARYALAND
jgi:sigma-B regulation protein RsbU (phosphoserine phosphatase)